MESLEQLIKDHAHNNIEYGKGKEIVFDENKIYDKLKKILFSNKVLIDLEENLNFQFLELGNPYN